MSAKSAAGRTAPISAGQRAAWAVSDTLVMGGRNLLHYVRVPDLLAFSTIMPVIFQLLFAYVFGGVIRIPGVRYIDYMMPGIFVQAIVFGLVQTGVGLAQDLSSGMVDRFRSLPIARSAVLLGRTLSDTVRNSFVVLLMTAVGFLLGFRFHAGLVPAVSALALVVVFGLALSLISASIGLTVASPESAQAAGFTWVVPIIFASSAFVPVATMPGWLQAVAKINPVTPTVDALRALTFGGPTAGHLLRSLAWTLGIVVLFTPLAVARYRRTA